MNCVTCTFLVLIWAAYSAVKLLNGDSRASHIARLLALGIIRRITGRGAELLPDGRENEAATPNRRA